jgi:CRP/FNR family transcriptional regulator, cyclic AMP receptor protein
MSIEALRNCVLFTGFSERQLRDLAGLFEGEHLQGGQVIFAQDDPADRLFVLLSGRVAIRFKPHDGDVLTVTEIGEGGVFGWSAALGRRSYTSSAVCLEAGDALGLRGSDLRHLCETQPETGVVILERLAEVIAQRLRSTHEQVVELLQLGMRSQPPS